MKGLAILSLSNFLIAGWQAASAASEIHGGNSGAVSIGFAVTGFGAALWCLAVALLDSKERGSPAA